jgi:hypothetical protein
MTTHDATAVRLQNDATDSSTSHRQKLSPGALPANEACHRMCHCNGVRVLIQCVVTRDGAHSPALEEKFARSWNTTGSNMRLYR